VANFKDIIKKLPYSLLFYFLFSFSFLLFLHFDWRVQALRADFDTVARIILGFLSSYLLWASGFLLIARRWPKALFSLSILCIYFLLFAYHLRTGTNFSISLLIDNWQELFYAKSWEVIADSLKPRDWRHLVLIFVSGLILEHFFKLLSRGNIPRFAKDKFAYPLLYLAILVQPFKLYEEISYLWQEGIESLIPDFKYQKLAEKWDTQMYPLKQKQEGIGILQNKKSVILVLVESLNGMFLEKKTKDGQEILPYLNSLYREELSLTPFYGNSIQTTKGHLASLCSTIPLLKGKLYRKTEIQLRCLPEILKEKQYQTFFYQAYARLSFDNTQNFLKQNGMDNIFSMSNLKLSKKEIKEYDWGWGLQDDIFYQKSLEHFLQHRKANYPFFLVLSPISNHMKFRSLPKKYRTLFPAPGKNPYQLYLNSLHATDDFLKKLVKFWRQNLAQESILIITGDHSYPAGEHNNFHNESYAYEENFRTPFVILGMSESEKNKFIPNQAYSQLDIAPSLFDLLGISAEHAFQGHSFFKKTEKKVIPLIQPYDGTYLALIQWPWKLVHQKRTQRTWLYNLETDPLEKMDQSQKETAALQELYLKSGMIWLNEKLAKENRYFPSSGAKR